MKPRIYLDQNILGYLIEEQIILPSDNFDYIFSETHFKEFPKFNYKTFCDILDKLQARLIKLNLNDNFEILDDATLYYYEPVEPLYLNFIENYKPQAESSADGLLSYFYGSQDKNNIESFVDILNNSISEPLGEIKPIISIYEDMLSEFDDTFSKLIPKIESLENNRKILGTDKGRLNKLEQNVLSNIFSLISNHLGVNIETFLINQIMNKPKYLKVVGLHSILNSFGFNPDKSITKIQSIPNIRHDSEHIGYGIFCDFLLSEDRRLINKAAAIYEYLKLPATPVLVIMNNK